MEVLYCVSLRDLRMSSQQLLPSSVSQQLCILLLYSNWADLGLVCTGARKHVKLDFTVNFMHVSPVLSAQSTPGNQKCCTKNSPRLRRVWIMSYSATSWVQTDIAAGENQRAVQRKHLLYLHTCWWSRPGSPSLLTLLHFPKGIHCLVVRSSYSGWSSHLSCHCQLQLLGN